MKKQSTSLVIREIEIKTSMRSCFTKQQEEVKTNVPKDLKKLKPSFTVAGKVKWYNYFVKQLVSFFKTLNTELPYDLAISLLGNYSREMKTYVHTKMCT